MQSHWQIVDEGGIIVSNSPEELWKSACNYFKWNDENPLIAKETLRSGKEAGKQVTVEYTRPYSIKALCLHCGISEEYLKDIRNSRDNTSGWYIAISRILYIIFVQNQELATIGVYNPIFTAKLLNMDRFEDTQTSNIKIEIVGEQLALSESENEVLTKLESDFLKTEE